MKRTGEYRGKNGLDLIGWTWFIWWVVVLAMTGAFVLALYVAGSLG